MKGRYKMNIDFTRGNGTYKMNQKIEEKENEYVIKVKMTIKKDKYGEKMIDKMIEKQESPVVTILKQMESERKKEMKEGKYERPLYEK